MRARPRYVVATFDPRQFTDREARCADARSMKHALGAGAIWHPYPVTPFRDRRRERAHGQSEHAVQWLVRAAVDQAGLVSRLSFARARGEGGGDARSHRERGAASHARRLSACFRKRILLRRRFASPHQEGVTPASHTHPPHAAHAAHVGHTAAVTARLLLDQLGNHGVGG
jgi:hypothetical protein